MEPLHLHEELMLLALREEKGTIEFGAWYTQAVGGGLVAELLLEGRVRVVPGEGKQKPTLEVVRNEPLGDDLIDDCLATIAIEPKPRDVGHWVRKAADLKDLKSRAAHSLIRRGILRMEESKVLLLFTRTVYPEVDPEPELAIRARLREAIFGEGEVDPRTVALVSLARATGLLHVAFERKELKAAKERLDAIVSGEVSGEAVRQLVGQIQTTIMIASVVPVITS